MKTLDHPNNDRQIRVFISSTFRDMMRERDLLVKEVFPELRSKCAKRFVTFTEVDLRWGITEAQANEGQVLPLCLVEIDRSRPYFIGLLGERYGWIPDTIPPEVISREPWLQEHVLGRTSVTELEILHGVLNNPNMQSHAFFYFRDPAYVKDATLTDDERWDMIERDIRADVERYGPDEATRRTEERKAKLAAMKQRIRDSKLPIVEPYANPKSLAEIVRKQFDELIDRLYPEDEVPDPLAQELMSHEAHAKNKLFACIDRPMHLAALNAFAETAENDGKGLVVTGESGGGKTVLLAAWARDWAKKHPTDFIFQHYFGATPNSASPEGFLRRLLGELKSRFVIGDDIPTDPEKLRETLPDWLAQASAKVSSLTPTGGQGAEAASNRPSRIILVLEGLNQVQGTEPDQRLRFLPPRFPPYVVALASALPGSALNALRQRVWTEYDLPCASEAEVDAMVSEYLTIHARTLESKLRYELVTAPGTKNLLFLRIVLEELRQFGSLERLPQYVRHYLEANNPKDLLRRVLIRWQEDFDANDTEQDKSKRDLVRRTLTHLWASRHGLSELEWLDLLGDGSEPLPRALWAPFFFVLEPHLSQRTGLFAFGHDFLRQAVKAAFVSTDNLQQAAHRSAADYFKHQPICRRKLSELPWQMSQARCWTELVKILTNPHFLESAWEVDEDDVRARWAEVSASSAHHVDQAYAEVVSRQPISNLFAVIVATLLRDSGKLASAAILQSKIIDRYREIGDRRALALAQGFHARTLSELGQSADAAKHLREQVDIWRNLHEPKALQAALGNLASHLFNIGHHLEAFALAEEQEAICRTLPGKTGLFHALVTRSNISVKLGQMDQCDKLLDEAECLCREQGLNDWLQTVLGNRAELFYCRDNLVEAMRLNREKEEICRKLGFQRGLTFTLHQKGKILLGLGKSSEALERHCEEERICREMGFIFGLQASLRAQANILHIEGEIMRACSAVRESEIGCRSLGASSELAETLNLKGQILQSMRSVDAATIAYEEAVCIYRKLQDFNGLQQCLGNLGILQQERGNPEVGIALHEEEIVICQKLQIPKALQAAVGNLAGAYHACGRTEEAIRMLGEQQSICRRNGFMDGLARSLYNQAMVLLCTLGRVADARTVALEALSIARAHTLDHLVERVSQLIIAINESNKVGKAN